MKGKRSPVLLAQEAQKRKLSARAIRRKAKALAHKNGCHK
jgi:hypothetical protein